MREAWQLWGRGISVVPVPMPSRFRDGKKPEIAWKEFQSRRPTRAEMRWWFRSATNYAVVTGRVSGIVVVDVDDRAALRWLRWNHVRSPWVVKTAKGWHYYYRCPAKPAGNRVRVAGAKIDVRGDGGYVIGPGSSHVSGAKYQCLGNWSVPKSSLPVFDASILARPAPAPAPVERPTGDVVMRARRYLARTPVPCVGHGSDQATFIAACRLVRGFGVKPNDAAALLKEWAGDFDMWWLKKKVETASRYGTEITGGKL